MADQGKKFASEGMITYGYILLYIALSSGQIFFNKVSLEFRFYLRLILNVSAHFHEFQSWESFQIWNRNREFIWVWANDGSWVLFEMGFSG